MISSEISVCLLNKPLDKILEEPTLLQRLTTKKEIIEAVLLSFFTKISAKLQKKWNNFTECTMTIK